MNVHTPHQCMRLWLGSALLKWYCFFLMQYKLQLENIKEQAVETMEAAKRRDGLDFIEVDVAKLQPKLWVHMRLTGANMQRQDMCMPYWVPLHTRCEPWLLFRDLIVWSWWHNCMQLDQGGQEKQLCSNARLVTLRLVLVTWQENKKGLPDWNAESYVVVKTPLKRQSA